MNGNLLDNNGLKLSESSYQPNDDVKKLVAGIQIEYKNLICSRRTEFSSYFKICRRIYRCNYFQKNDRI